MAQPFVDFVKDKFYTEYLEALKEFVRIPSLSPLYDAEWETNKNLDKQCDHLINFLKSQELKGMEYKVLRDEGRTPFLIVTVEKFGECKSDECVLMYGHMDKQPFGDGWETDPCDPVIKDGKMYGRGCSDDGYSLLSSVLAIKTCQALGKSHPQIVITIEGSEEGELFDLIYYLSTYKHLLHKPTLVICLDALAASTDSLTVTTSLRGVLNFDLTVKVGTNNVHSGSGGGIVPHPFTILNCLINRIQDQKTQEVIDDLQLKDIPEHRMKETIFCGEKLDFIGNQLPFAEGVKSLAFNNCQGDKKQENTQLMLNSYWKSQLAMIGVEGLPSISNAGNVLVKEIKARYSMRLPPTLSSQEVGDKLKAILTAEGPETFGAKIDFEMVDNADGFDAPDLPKNIAQTLDEATAEIFDGAKPLYVGCGGSIPFMEVFAQHFPGTNFMLTGVLFIDSNAHSANENIDLEYTRKFTTALAVMLSKL